MAAFKQSGVSPRSFGGNAARDIRLKRLRVRCWRRGTREMDLILGRFFETHHATWEDHFLDLLESLLEENDHDIYAWLTGNSEPPGQFDPLLALVRAKNLINL